MNNIILFNITGYLTVVLQMAIVLNITDIKWTKKNLALLSFAVYIPHAILFNLIMNNYSFSMISIVVWIILMFCAYMLFFKQSWRKSIFMALGQYIFLGAGINYVGLFIINNLPDNTRFFILENLFMPRVLTIALYIILFFYTRRWSVKGLSSLNYLFYKHRVFYSGFFLFFGLFDVLHIADPEYIGSVTETIAVTLFTVVFIHSLWHLRTKKQLEITERELDLQKLLLNSQKVVLDDLRLFKHGTNAVLNTISGLVDGGDASELKSYMNQVLAQISPPQTTELPDSIKEIPLLRGILSEKLARAEMNGVRFGIKVEGDINLKYCSDLNYTQMIDILLDNGLEAAEQSAGKKLDLIIRYEDRKLVSIITNSCDWEVDLGRIFDQGYSTKPKPSGHGLHQLRMIQGKYRKMGYTIEISTTLKDKIFTQTLIV